MHNREWYETVRNKLVKLGSHPSWESYPKWVVGQFRVNIQKEHHPRPGQTQEKDENQKQLQQECNQENNIRATGTSQMLIKQAGLCIITVRWKGCRQVVTSRAIRGISVHMTKMAITRQHLNINFLPNIFPLQVPL